MDPFFGFQDRGSEFQIMGGFQGFFGSLGKRLLKVVVESIHVRDLAQHQLLTEKALHDAGSMLYVAALHAAFITRTRSENLQPRRLHDPQKGSFEETPGLRSGELKNVSSWGSAPK